MYTILCLVNHVTNICIIYLFSFPPAPTDQGWGSALRTPLDWRSLLLSLTRYLALKFTFSLGTHFDESYLQKHIFSVICLWQSCESGFTICKDKHVTSNISCVARKWWKILCQFLAQKTVSEISPDPLLRICWIYILDQINFSRKITFLNIKCHHIQYFVANPLQSMTAWSQK